MRLLLATKQQAHSIKVELCAHKLIEQSAGWRESEKFAWWTKWTLKAARELSLIKKVHTLSLGSDRERAQVKLRAEYEEEESGHKFN